PDQRGAMGTREQKLYDLLPAIEMLRRAEYFKSVPAHYLARIAEVAQQKTYYDGEMLTRQGIPADALYVLCDGHVDVVVGDKTMWQVSAPDTLGEISLIDKQGEPASARVTGELRVLRIAAHDFGILLATQPAFSRALLDRFALRLR